MSEELIQNTGVAFDASNIGPESSLSGSESNAAVRSSAPGNAADFADAAQDMLNKKNAKLANEARHMGEEERKILQALPNEVKEEVIERSAFNEAWNEIKEKAPSGAMMFAAFSVILLSMGALFTAFGVLGSIAAAASTGAIWVGGNAAYKKYQETRESLEQEIGNEVEPVSPEKEKAQEVEPDYRAPGTREAGEMIIAGNSLTSFPGVVAFIQDGISDSRDVLQEAGVNTRRTLDGILKQGKRSAVDHAVKDAIESQEAMRG